MTEQEYNTVLELSVNRPVPEPMIQLVERFIEECEAGYVVSMLRRWLKSSQTVRSH